MSRPHPQRLPAIDLLKAVASQLIVLHHLAAYGPLSEAAGEVAPALVSWLYDHARVAVQVFLVVGGYLSARSLAAMGEVGAGQRLAAVANRYLRLVVPFAGALALAMLCAAVARWAFEDDFIPAAPSLAQAAAHLTLVQTVLGYESLTVGAWYVAIDFQLFVVLALFSWQSARAYHSRTLLMVLTGGAMVASLFWFNRHPAFDAWAPYFFGAYGLGAMAWCVAGSRRPRLGLAFMALVGIAALVVDFRWRILVALVSALILGAGRGAQLGRLFSTATVEWLGKVSYSLFLVHFPVLLLANAIYAWVDGGLVMGVASFFAAWGVSIAGAAVFHRWVEMPAGRLRVAALGLPAFVRRMPALARRALPAFLRRALPASF